MRSLIYVITVVLLLPLVLPSAVEAANIKHRRSLYADNAQLPLSYPEGVACRGESIVVADTGNERLVRYRLTPQKITAEGVVPLAGSVPLVVQLNAADEIYVLDGKSRQILKISAAGKPLGAVEPQGVPAPKTIVPRSFAIDPEGTLYLLDIFAERVLLLDADGNFLEQFPFPEDYRFFSDLAVGPQGGIYLLDSVAGAVYRKTRNGDAFELLSDGLKAYMNFPTSLALDSRGELYLLDQYGSGLAVLARDGSFQGRKFGMGWEDAQFHYPTQICINEQNSLAVADRSSSRVQVFSILED